MKSINVKGQKYRIVRKPIDEFTLAQCDKTKKAITIIPDLDEKDYYLALLHEYCHALANEIGIDQFMSGQAEEIMAESFSTDFYKNFIKPLLKKLKAKDKIKL